MALPRLRPFICAFLPGCGVIGLIFVFSMPPVGDRSISSGIPGISVPLFPIIVCTPSSGTGRVDPGCVKVIQKESAGARVTVGAGERGETMSITESTTTISPELLAIYRSSNYRVTEKEGRGFVMHIDEPSSMLGALMERHGARSAVFVSAYNPASEPRTEAENQGLRRVWNRRSVRRDTGYSREWEKIRTGVLRRTLSSGS